MGPPVPAFPPNEVPRVRRPVPPSWRRPVIDSLAKADIQFCTPAQGFRIRTFHSGSVHGDQARAEPGGLLVALRTRSGDGSRLVAWSDIRSVEILEARERTPGEAFERGAQIGYAAGILLALAIIPVPGDFGFLVYPITITIAALPGALVGGVIGLKFRGSVTTWDHCWP